VDVARFGERTVPVNSASVLAVSAENRMLKVSPVRVIRIVRNQTRKAGDLELSALVELIEESSNGESDIKLRNANRWRSGTYFAHRRNSREQSRLRFILQDTNLFHRKQNAFWAVASLHRSRAMPRATNVYNPCAQTGS